MATLTLKILGDTSDVTEKIGGIKTALEGIGKSPVKISIETIGLEALDKASKQIKDITNAKIKEAEASAKLANAIARETNAKTRAKEVNAKLKAQRDSTNKAVKEEAAAVQSVATAVQAEATAVKSATQVQALLNDSLKNTTARINEVRNSIMQLAQAYYTLMGAGGVVGNGFTAMPASSGAGFNLLGSPQSYGFTLNGTPYGYGTYNYTMPQFQSTALTQDWRTPYYVWSNANRYYNSRALPPSYGSGWTYGNGVIDLGDLSGQGSGGGGSSGGGNPGDVFTGVADGADKAGKAVGRFADSTVRATAASSKMLDSLKQYVGWYLRWTVISNIFQSITSSIRDAIKTMREVDDELVTIRKVTGFSDSQIESIRQQAYTTASAYGVGAADYLSSVAAFSRAGYKEQSAALAELSTKTQIVGDTTEEVANQFLLSVDAAYKYSGSIEKLSKVLDGANELDNKYATSIEKIAEGMGIVAPVAAQVHVDIDELAAAIGTITAVTQRSGSEAARALRALFLNIVGDTKTEIDEGVTWTTGEIAGLKDVIKQFAPEAYNTAQALGEVIDPMEAIGGLAKSFEAGLLNEQKLMEMVSDIGGKLRTSQLLAIIQNWDMYQRMLVDYGNALGSADKEVANALDSWTRKTEILKNTFAEFISHLVETKEVKGAIDLLTNAIKALDNESTKFVLEELALIAATTGVVKLFSGIPQLFSTIAVRASMSATAFKALTAEEVAAKAATMGFSGSLKALWTAFVSSPAAMIAAAAAAVYGLVKLYDYLNVTAEEHAEKAEESIEKYKELQGEIDELNGKLDSNIELIKDANEAGRNDAYTIRLKRENELLEAQIKLLSDKAKKEREEAQREAIAGLTSEDYQIATRDGSGYVVDYTDDDYTNVKDVNILQYVDHLLKLGRAGEDVKDSLLEVVPTLVTLESALDTSTEEGELWSRAIATATTYINSYLDSLTRSVGETNEFSNSQESASEQSERLNITLQDQVAIYSQMKEKLTPLTAALSEMNEKGYMTESTMQALIEAFPDLQSAISVTTDGFVIDTQAIKDNIVAQSAVYQVVYNNALAAAQTVASAENLKKAGIDATTGSIKEQLLAMAKLYAVSAGEAYRAGGDWQYYVKQMNTAYGALRDLNMAEANLQNANTMLNGFAGATGTPAKDSTKSGGGGGGSASKETDTVLENIQERIKLLKSELSIMEERGDATGDIVAKQREIQEALHEEAEHLRAVGGSQSDINALSLEWLQIQNKIKKALEDQQKALEDIRKDAAKQAQEDALSMLEAEENNATAALQEQLDLLKSQKDTIEDTREEEEKRLAVEQARIALENAQKERNIRQYNAATGQWEWVANAETVQKAQEDLQKAQDSLSDYYRNRSISALEANIKTIQDQYSALRNAIKDFAEKIENGTAQFGEALDYLTAAVGGGLGGVLGQVAGVFGTSGSSVSDSVIAQMKSNSAAWTAASGDAATQKALSDANLALGTSQGWYRGADGRWYYPDGTPVYDSGGVLHGIGGIKATRRDEIILPPDISESLLKAERYGSFDALLGHLGIVTAAANSFAGFGNGTINRNSIGSQHNGDVFEMGGVTIGEAQARGMTVYDFAQMAKTLALHRGS